jgi:hypothetical protein
MFVHTVLFKWRPEASEEDIKAVMTDLRGLKERCDMIRELHCGQNSSEYHQGYTHGLTVKFDNKEDLFAYRAHPAHQAVVQKILTIEADSVGMDIETV